MTTFRIITRTSLNMKQKLLKMDMNRCWKVALRIGKMTL